VASFKTFKGCSIAYPFFKNMPEKATVALVFAGKALW
jgi:hypothetical protein